MSEVIVIRNPVFHSGSTEEELAVIKKACGEKRFHVQDAFPGEAHVRVFDKLDDQTLEWLLHSYYEDLDDSCELDSRKIEEHKK